MSESGETRVLKLRRVALEFRSIALHCADEAFVAKMNTTAAELEAIADSLMFPHCPAAIALGSGAVLH